MKLCRSLSVSSLTSSFQPKVRTVDEVIKEAELKLITIDDYSDNQFQLRTKKEVKEDLGHFLSQRWL
jgi:hypothetical protein